MSCGRKGFIGLEIRYRRLHLKGDVKTEGMPLVIGCTDLSGPGCQGALGRRLKPEWDRNAGVST